jgi:hypothetical protein
MRTDRHDVTHYAVILFYFKVVADFKILLKHSDKLMKTALKLYNDIRSSLGRESNTWPLQAQRI